MSVKYIFTEQNNCQDCYKCIRECPVKAIKMIDQSASIISENCIYCGHCTAVCPSKAKRVKDDMPKVKYLIDEGYRVIASLAPSWVSEFPDCSEASMVAILKQLGFAGVSETAIGAEMVSTKIRKMLAEQERGLAISPCCPSVVEIIHKYYPAYSKYIMNVDTPMLAHGKFLKEYYGDNIKVVFIGPCIAKKYEADMNPGVVDAVETFRNLKKWMRSERIDIMTTVSATTDTFVPFRVKTSTLYPVPGGMLQGLETAQAKSSFSLMGFSGVKTILPLIRDLDKLDSQTPVFLEMLACDEGCVNGPETTSEQSLLMRKLKVHEYMKKVVDNADSSLEKCEIENAYSYKKPVKCEYFPESKIAEILKAIGKYTKSDELNCGGCGYECCRDFAKAILSGMAERKMCVSYMRRVAMDKASVLLQRMPYGVVIVDKNLRIQESNKAFAELAGDEAIFAYEAKPGLEGADLRKLIPFSDYFQNLIESDASYFERDIRAGKHFLHLSIFTLEGNNVLCAIIHNLRTTELNRDEMIRRTRSVVRENLETVQKIAFHLGENASRMESLLNSIIDIQDESYDE